MDSLWVRQSPRPYDPPVTDIGLQEARAAGYELRDKVKNNNSKQ